MPSVYWRGRSAYLQWREGKERFRKSLGQVSAHDAETHRLAKEVELRGGVTLSSNTLGEFLLRYFPWYERQFPASFERTADILGRVFRAFHRRPLASLTTAELETWKERRLSEKQVGTVLKELRALSAALTRAVKWGLLAKNPAKGVEAPRETRSRDPVWYSKKQLARLYEVSGPRSHWWRLYANTGMRAAEGRQLRWEDVRDGGIYIVSDEGARTKSGKWRLVPLSKGARTALNALRAPGAIYVLPPIHPKSLSRAFAKDAVRAGLKGSLHSLRHTFASHLVSAGKSLYEVKELLGHATIKTTEIYAHRDATRLKRGVTGLDL